MGTCCTSDDIVHIQIEDAINTTGNTASNLVDTIGDKLPTFDDIIDEKHMKYMKHYDVSSKEIEEKHTTQSLFWGIGIENETYLMHAEKYGIKSFRNLKQKRERYSVDYYKSFIADGPCGINALLQRANTLDTLTYPMYINSHTFQATDVKQEHRIHYDVGGTPNVAFTESLHDILLRESDYYKSVYNTSFVFDGDSIEFITQDFYCATVDSCMKELISQKQRFLSEIQPYFQTWFSKAVVFPDHNYGFVSFLTTKNRNLGICNNGTIHINLTLPTMLENGVIQDKTAFIKEHLNLVPYFQLVEPLIVACYGTPDIFSLLSDNEYAVGSQRVALSRYISVQTFDAEHPINGKLLLMDRPKEPAFWQNAMTAYHLNEKIGYDINFNKFKNHGIELRFFDWFPEEYLADILHFFVLLSEHAKQYLAKPFDKTKYNTIIQNCIKKGFSCTLSLEECTMILEDLQLPQLSQSPLSLSLSPSQSPSPHSLLSHISNQLYAFYHDGPIVKLLSPNQPTPTIQNYNWIAYQKLHDDLFSKPELIIRAEANPFESRTPIIPKDIQALHAHFRVCVETATTRCYSDEDYKANGAKIVPKDYWITSKNSYVLGIKHPIHSSHSAHSTSLTSNTLLHFAHCFKGQHGASHILDTLRPSVFLDYEYMLDTQGKRVISFCGQSGKIGCYVALMAYYKSYYHATRDIPPFDEELYQSMLYSFTARHKPSVLLIGHGTVGKSCKAVLDHLCIPCTIWTSKDAIHKKVILGHDILLHAIRLDETRHIAPFLERSDLEKPSALSVICDISCDLGHPQNTLPIYDEYTTKQHPVIRMNYGQNKVNLIAINCLPSLEPIVSSDQFSAKLVSLLPDLPHFQRSASFIPNAAIFNRAYQKFKACLLSVS